MEYNYFDDPKTRMMRKNGCQHIAIKILPKINTLTDVTMPEKTAFSNTFFIQTQEEVFENQLIFKSWYISICTLFKTIYILKEIVSYFISSLLTYQYNQKISLINAICSKEICKNNHFFFNCKINNP